MSGRVIRIERVAPRKGVVEEPVLTGKGYELAAGGHGRRSNRVDDATHVRTLDEAAALLAQGFSLRMGAKGMRPSLIAPQSLRVVHAEPEGTG